MNLDTRIKEGLRAAADAEPALTPAALSGVKANARQRERRNRLVGFAVGALALVAVVFVTTIYGGVEGPYVAEGERLLATDPVVVQGALSPNPRFDTSVLGVEEPLSPLTDSTLALEVVQLVTEDGQLVRVTTVGTTVDGFNTIIQYSEETVSSGRRLQIRCHITSHPTQPVGGASCGGDDIELLRGKPGGLARPESPAEPNSYTVGGDGVLTWDVPSDTSVVVLTVNSEPRWQRPIGGVAVFDTDFMDGDRFTLAALDEDGTELKSFKITARLGTSTP